MCVCVCACVRVRVRVCVSRLDSRLANSARQKNVCVSRLTQAGLAAAEPRQRVVRQKQTTLQVRRVPFQAGAAPAAAAAADATDATAEARRTLARETFLNFINYCELLCFCAVRLKRNRKRNI